ncbi:unnamed protein product [Effrenium voratum]|nr:unnamed protein product [Effrenium voratum]CAJ1376451.1 unnamed protein product [Effrenium voratum]CAJ1454808.1 unnamed protein product [Effrenium voratum]
MNMRQADAGANLNEFYHAQVATLVLRKDQDSDFYPAPGRADLPRHYSHMPISDIGLHDMKEYIERLLIVQLNGKDAHGQKLFSNAYHFAYLAWGAYETQKDRNHRSWTMEELIHTNLPDWQLVAQHQHDTLEAVDNIWLTQNVNSLDCLIVFEGTHTFNQFFRNLNSSAGRKDGYCGFSDIHNGYVSKLHWLMKHVMPILRPQLAKCPKVGCTGHSLGGSLCHVFAACANSGRAGDPDYELQKWTAGSPELMPAVRQRPLSKDNFQLPTWLPKWVR